MVLDLRHGGAMLSGIPDHMDQLQRTEWAREAMNFDQNLATVPSHRIATVLNDLGAKIVDYLSIDVEGAELEVLRCIDFGKVQLNVIGLSTATGSRKSAGY
jgi:FkbM family methyltransferase